MTAESTVVLHPEADHPFAILRRMDNFGITEYDLCGPPLRLWADGDQSPGQFLTNIDAARVKHLPTPAQALGKPTDGETWMGRSRASVARLWAYYLLAEDPQRRLDAREVSTLAHQVSLVRHILDSEPHLSRVLVADEVGLGKTVEAGLLIQAWLEREPHLRVLYLAPARLVPNVVWEFNRLGLRFRQWSASPMTDGRIDDPLLVASIHRAVHPKNYQAILAAARCDILVIDECHHLSDWSPGGGDPTRKFKLVGELISRQAPSGRVVFLSGTPHQGSVARFENLLGLLRRDDEPAEALAGRVIYRTKDDIRDWDGRPLFPGRKVAPPIPVDLGPDYRTWIEHIRTYFTTPPGTSLSTPQRRSATWRRAQALQWAASSPQAGLGYLVRQALRAGWNWTDKPALAEALEAIRPYRQGAVDEPIERLYSRIRKEIDQQRQDADVEDIEEFDDEAAAGSPGPGLESLLRNGVRLLRATGDEKWEVLKAEILDRAGDEKIVLFAQPIETVTALAGYLERVMGVPPALIIGGQNEEARQAQIDRFRRPDGPRYLVSSRAGGEGINLQVARRLVHLDIPWNPMEMEQRVGRVHRFGSRQTILVDTLVVKDSREVDAYKVARHKLQQITHSLVEPEKFETLYSRVMSLIPPEEFADVLIESEGPGLDDTQQRRLAEMVQRGYQSWDTFHRRYSDQQRAIRALSPGLANWDDLRYFLAELGGAELAEGFRTLRFENGECEDLPVASEVPVATLRLADGKLYIAQEHDGMPVTGPGGAVATQVGLNVRPVAEVMRRLATSPTVTGAAHLRWAGERPSNLGGPTVGVLVFLRQTFRAQTPPWVEHTHSLHAYQVDKAGDRGEWTGADRAVAFRGLLHAVIRREPTLDGPLQDALARCETECIRELRRLSDDDRAQGLRHAVLPLLAAIVTT